MFGYFVGSHSHFHAVSFESFQLGFGCAFATRYDGAGVSHALAGRGGLTSNVTDNRLLDVLFDELCRFFFSIVLEFFVIFL